MSAAAVLQEREPESASRTLVRGLQLTPGIRQGLTLTLLLALAATAGRVVAPITAQLTIDALAGDSVPLTRIASYIAGGLGAVLLTSSAGYAMNYRLARATETALSELRARAFRHIHDLSVLHHATEHRGSLVSRVTGDIDQISQFMQWGGIMLVVNLGQLVLATTVMAVYSWQLTLIVLATFTPLMAILRWFQRRLTIAYQVVRQRVGAMLSVVGESVVAAPVIRAYSIEQRTNQRVTEAVHHQFDAAYRAVRLSALMFSSGDFFAALATAGAVVAGVLLGVGGELSPGRLVAFMFLVTLFVGPVQVAAEVLDQAQTAIAGWRRVLDVLDTVPDVADPELRADAGIDIPPGPIRAEFEQVSFRYPLLGGRPGELGEAVLRDVTVEIPAQARVAVVGETGSGKTTFAKLLTRLMDPTEGRILVNGVHLHDVRFASLRQRIVMVPQDGYLFDTTIAENVGHGRPGMNQGEIQLAFTELGLAEWVESLPHGLDTRVGERGELLSVGERQLVALARAYVANPDLLVLDEATSAVDPATEVRIQRALESLTRGRTALAIAHRLSTAEAADEILVFDRGRIVQRGHHRDLLVRDGVYARLQASWRARGGIM